MVLLVKITWSLWLAAWSINKMIVCKASVCLVDILVEGWGLIVPGGGREHRRLRWRWQSGGRGRISQNRPRWPPNWQRSSGRKSERWESLRLEETCSKVSGFQAPFFVTDISLIISGEWHKWVQVSKKCCLHLCLDDTMSEVEKWCGGEVVGEVE